MALAVAGISILIAVYLYANVKRLAAEAQSKPA
jgi:hypothetical protein